MDIKDLKDKLVAVLGYGVEGQAVTRYLLKHGIKPVLFDQRPWNSWSDIEKLDIKKLELNFIFGSDAFEELKGFDIVFRSPGVNPTSYKLPATSLVTSQTKWFFEHCPAKIIGVTGTKGKGTTCSLIYEMLKCSAPIYRQSGEQPINGHATSNTYLTGNIGKIQPLDILDDLKKDDWVVYELSSFQLQDLKQSPHIGVVLMVTQEHLDYHKDELEYTEAKEAIVKFQTKNDFAVINADFQNSIKIGELGEGYKLYFSRKKEVQPGYFIKQGKIAGIGPKGEREEIFDTKDLLLKGEHNWENICAAIIASFCAGAKLDAVINVLKNFKGLEHRLEFVAEKNGIKFYNDSFSTTPETAIAAIDSFDEPEIIILGGSSKNSDFTELGKTISTKKNIKAIILIGEEAPRIKKTMADGYHGQILESAKSMQEIMHQVSSVAVKGDVVLLSPACASFGMFKNYIDRGNQFKAEVSKL